MIASESSGFSHTPVMRDRITDLLAPAITASVPDGSRPIAVDGTVGLGGHTAHLLTTFPDLVVVGIDRDAQALDVARDRLMAFGDRFIPFHSVFDDVQGALAAASATSAAAVLFDLGVSSLQLDSDQRGFAYSRTTLLDMRMDTGSQVTAEDVVNEYSPEELARVFSQYGEERFAHRIARRIADRRAAARITTTTELADLCEAAVPMAVRRKGHPAKRVFQALRIEVNDELGALRDGLENGVRALAPGGRMAVLAYHSLEDRIVKRAFTSGAHPPVPARLPVVPDDAQPFLELITRGAEKPADQEVAINPRAASARLRVAALIRPVPSSWTVAA